MTQKQPLACSMRPLCVLYGCSMISHPVRHLELSTYKGTKKVRETLDMVGGECNRIHQNTTNKITNY